MDTLVLSDPAWRRYRYELTGQFMAPDFNPNKPPVVADLLSRDGIPQQDPVAERKVDRHAPAAAAAETISSNIVTGEGVTAQFTNLVRREPMPTYTVFQAIGIDARRSWIEQADLLQHDSGSRLNDFLRIFDARPPLALELSATVSHIRSGAQLASEIGGFLGALAGVVVDIKDDEERMLACHSVVPTAELGRAVVHAATVNTATPPWMSMTKLQLHPTSRGHELRNRHGQRLWQGGDRPSSSVTPRLMCPVHAHGRLEDIFHAAINEAFARKAL